MSTPVTAVPPQPVAEQITDPSSLEVCDRCGANALWRIILASGNSLTFCGHHAFRHGFVAGSESHQAYADENKLKGSEN